MDCNLLQQIGVARRKAKFRRYPPTPVTIFNTMQLLGGRHFSRCCFVNCSTRHAVPAQQRGFTLSFPRTQRKNSTICQATTEVGKLITKTEIPAFIPRADLMDQLVRWATIEIQESGVANVGMPCKVRNSFVEHKLRDGCTKHSTLHACFATFRHFAVFILHQSKFSLHLRLPTKLLVRVRLQFLICAIVLMGSCCTYCCRPLRTLNSFWIACLLFSTIILQYIIFKRNCSSLTQVDLCR